MRRAMKRLIKSTMNHFPSLRKMAYENYRLFNFLGAYRSANKLKNQDLEEIFTEHYNQNVWINDQSVSGDGSTVEYTEKLRTELPFLFSKFEIGSILDAPCGDYNWFQYVDRSEGILYVGGDIVAKLVEKNNERYGNRNTRFEKLDITTDPLPAADLMICRDALFHFSDSHILRTLENFANSEIKYILTTSHTDCKSNFDIVTGQFRLLNLEKPPFNFGEPLFTIDDWVEGFPVRKMCLWDRGSMAEFIAKMSMTDA